MRVSEDIQFLKHSPTLTTTGSYKACLNLGVLLRLIGTCKGDLPGRGPLEPRATSYNHALVQGAYPRAHFSVVDNMRGADKIKSYDCIDKTFEYKVIVEGEHIFFDDASIYKRYRLNDLDVSRLIEFSNLGFGEFVSGPSFTKVLEKDYGLKASHSLGRPTSSPNPTSMW